MLFLVASALLASAEPATAPSAAQPSAPAAAVKPKKICHVEDAVTGSITPKRVCVTVPQAAPAPAQPQPAQDAARDKAQQQASTAASGTSN